MSRGWVRTAPLVLALGWFVFRFTTTLTFYEFGDETEKIVAATRIADGHRLYRDTFAHHGPLNYLFAHLVYAVTSSTDGVYYRALQALLFLLGGLVASRSPLLRSDRERRVAATILFASLGALAPAWLGHMLLYHAFAGLFFALALVLLFLPLILGIRVPAAAAAAGGCMVSLVVFSAYAYAASLAAVASATAVTIATRAAGESPAPALRAAAGGAAAATAAIVAWLALFGDWTGYWVYHVYFNQVVYSRFVSFSPLAPLEWLGSVLAAPLGAPGWLPAAGPAVFAVLVSTAALATLAMRTPAGPCAAPPFARAAAFAAIGVALVYLNPLGDDAAFRLAPVATSALVLWSVAGASATGSRWGWIAHGTFAASALLVFATAGSLHSGIGITPAEIARARVPLRPSDDAVFARVRRLVPPGEPILALPNQPAIYVWADRPPASGHFYYLPWQAAYEREPVDGFSIDLCADVRRSRPKVIYFDGERVWGRYELSGYAPCVFDWIRTRYRALEVAPRFHVRIDADGTGEVR